MTWMILEKITRSQDLLILPMKYAGQFTYNILTTASIVNEWVTERLRESKRERRVHKGVEGWKQYFGGFLNLIP